MTGIIHEGWMVYQRTVINPDTSPEDHELAYYSFMGGAYVLLNAIKKALDQDEGQDSKALQAIDQEMKDFAKMIHLRWGPPEGEA